MIYSMTGFGEAAAERDGMRYHVELKSLNNRYFKPTIKLPETVGALEPEIESALRKRVGRGTVVYLLKLRGPEASVAARVNASVLRSYADQLSDAGFTVAEPERMLMLPGVLEDPSEFIDESAELERHREVVLELTEKAVEKLLQMRRREGDALLADLLGHTARVAGHLEGVKARSPYVVNHYHDRLRARVNELLAKAELQVTEQDLLKEVSVFAERSDISEEIVRLDHHVKHFEEVCRSRDGEHVGRKLDFIAQEMLREANTIGSKANDAEIAGHIVEIKGAIDRLKEQVQNVE